ncbi:MAG TPA: phosphoglycerate mutase family protein [Fimbriiglobus sp.]|jgi:phosphohistidine phosphatase
MKLILVRHAEAVPIGFGDVRHDSERFLTDLGKRQALALADALKKAGATADVVVTSPLVRAVQTGGPIAAVLTPDKEPVVTEYLGFDEYRPKKLAAVISELGVATAVLVGHMPTLGQFAEWLLAANEGTIDFCKAAAAKIVCGKNVADGCGTLKWMLHPSFYMTVPTSM